MSSIPQVDPKAPEISDCVLSRLSSEIPDMAAGWLAGWETRL